MSNFIFLFLFDLVMVSSVAASSNSNIDSSVPNSFTSQVAANFFKTKYLPGWEKLYLHEGDGQYPMPPSNKIQDLVTSFKGITGIAVRTNPAVTVSEGQGYALFAAGMAKDTDALKGLAVGWQAMGQGYPDKNPLGGCGGVDSAKGCLCKAVKGAYMPAWMYPLNNCGGGCTGSAPDGDEDAITGLIYLAELTDDDAIRDYVVRSIIAFVMDDLGAGDINNNSRSVPVIGDIPKELQKMFLWRGGSCWGGYDTHHGDDNLDLCINPSYFSPGQWRLFRDFLLKYPKLVPSDQNITQLVTIINSSIVWGYNTLNRISCDSGVVSNWWTLPNEGWPWTGKLHCANSGTDAGAYGSDACRIPWRVALDAIWYPKEAAHVPLYDEQGKNIGFWGATHYSNRWSNAYAKLMVSSNSSCPSPDCVPYYSAIPMLYKFQSCPTCPKGFAASAWNAWGYFPPITTFSVPIQGMDPIVQQKWLDLFVSYIDKSNWPTQYFDKGQEIITTAIMGGLAWKPV